MKTLKNIVALGIILTSVVPAVAQNELTDEAAQARADFADVNEDMAARRTARNHDKYQDEAEKTVNWILLGTDSAIAAAGFIAWTRPYISKEKAFRNLSAEQRVAIDNAQRLSLATQEAAAKDLLEARAKLEATLNTKNITKNNLKIAAQQALDQVKAAEFKLSVANDPVQVVISNFIGKEEALKLKYTIAKRFGRWAKMVGARVFVPAFAMNEVYWRMALTFNRPEYNPGWVPGLLNMYDLATYDSTDNLEYKVYKKNVVRPVTVESSASTPAQAASAPSEAASAPVVDPDDSDSGAEQRNMQDYR